MFPPDGGDPTLAEMVGNMRQQLDAAETNLASAIKERDEARADASQWQGALRFCGGEWSDERGTMLNTIQRERARATAATAESDRLRRALEAVAPYVDCIVCYASTIDEHDGNRVSALVHQALKEQTP
jgi:hypothetical protein